MATHEDATLVVQLMQWGSQAGLQEAISAVFDDEFDHDEVEWTDHSVQTILTFGETVGTLVKHGVLDRALIYDLLWVDGLWERVGSVALRARNQMGQAALYENFEALALAVDAVDG